MMLSGLLNGSTSSRALHLAYQGTPRILRRVIELATLLLELIKLCHGTMGILLVPSYSTYLKGYDGISMVGTT
jgi:hypothetical protein